MYQATALIVCLMFVSLPYYEPSSARSIQRNMSLNHQDKENLNQVAESHPHIRQKRGWFSALSKGLTVASWSSYGASMAVTVYHAIRKCDDYRPRPCKHPTCEYLSPCPDFLCQNSKKNKDYVDSEKVNMKKELDQIDVLLLHAFQLEVDGKLANIDNQRILNYIERINQDVDRFANGIVSVDGGVSKKFQNKSAEIQAMVLDKRTTLDGIVTSPLLQGIFDKWTWDGTGRFVLSLALTVGYGVYGPLKQRYAINKIYKEMTADFTNKFQNQKSAVYPNGLVQPQLKNKFAYVQGLTTNEIKKQIKASAKAVHNANQASKTQGLVSKAITPVVNGLYTALSVWSIYKEIEKCQTITNDMQDTALNITGTRDEIEKIKATEVKPLLDEIYNQTWRPVISLLTNTTLLDLLEGIANLSVEANFTDGSPAKVITSFIKNIDAASSSTSSILSLQKQIIKALSTLQFQFKCLADKQHALSVIINDCKSGRHTLQVLHAEGESSYDLNEKSCIDGKVVPYTSLKTLKRIVSATASEKGWYDNCLLNDEHLLYRVCTEKSNGYVKAVDIVAKVNNSALSEEMVANFLTRCLPPEVTPKSKQDICTYYCLYQPTQKIAELVGLQESQVNMVITTCGICSVSDSEKTKMCSLHFCKELDEKTIETTQKLPLPTVKDVIRKCDQKCILNDAEKNAVCNEVKCKLKDSKNVAISLNLPQASIEELHCDSVMSQCMVSFADKKKILTMHCKLKASADQIETIMKISLERIENVVNSQTCSDFTSNGVKTG